MHGQNHIKFKTKEFIGLTMRSINVNRNKIRNLRCSVSSCI